MGRRQALVSVGLALLAWALLFVGHIAAAAAEAWGLFSVLSWSLGALGVALGGAGLLLHRLRAKDAAEEALLVVDVGQGLAVVLAAAFGWARGGVGLEMVAWPAASVLLWWVLRSGRFGSKWLSVP